MEDFEFVTRAGYSSSESSFDICEEFDDVLRFFSDGYVKVKSEGSSSDSDGCSSAISVSSIEDLYAGAIPEAESDYAKSIHGSPDHVRRLLAKEFRNKCTENMMLAFGPYENLHMSTSQFRQMQLREIMKEHVLSFLPAKSLSRFRCVSKVWDRWITGPLLAHRQSYNFRDMSGYIYQPHQTCGIRFLSFCRSAYGIPDLESLNCESSLISSSNGLLLYRTRGDITYQVCNPSTKRCKQLPEPSYYHGYKPAVLLAFEPSKRNLDAHYHVVCAFHRMDEPVLYFDVYSSKTNTWKCNDEVSLPYVMLQNNGFYLNGVAYWETTSNEVLMYDFQNEMYNLLPLPSDMPTGGTLGHMKGELCYVTASEFLGNVFEVSFYKDIGIRNSKISFYFDLGPKRSHNCRVLPGLWDGTVMILVDGCIHRCYLRDGKVQVIEDHRSLDPAAKFLPYVNSLVSVP